MEKTNSLTQLQKIAIEGEIAKAYATANHDSEILYRYYTMLTKSPKELRGLITELTYSLTEIDREKIKRVSLESLIDVTPVWLWIDRTIEDLKLSLTLGSIETEKTSLNKRMLRKKMIKSAFIFFCRNTAVVSPSATVELCRAILDREPLMLDFLEDACFAMIEQISELKADKKVKSEIIDIPFDIRNILCFQTETDVLNEITEVLDSSKNISFDLNDNKVKTEEHSKFVVGKKYLEEGKTVMLKSFDTKEEAVEFINNVKEKLRGMGNKFEFFIIGRRM